jgi:hypothetical protein
MESNKSIPESNPKASNYARVLAKISPELQKRNAELIDERFKAQIAVEETRYLTKVSRVLIGLWDLAGLILKSKPGDSIVIDCDSGRMYTGKVKHEKLKEIPQKVAGRVSMEMDTEGFHEYFMSRSWVKAFGSPRKNSWDSVALKAPKHRDTPVVDLFEDKLQEISMSDVTVNHLTGPNHYYYEVSIKDYPIVLGINAKINKVAYYIFQGKKHYV